MKGMISWKELRVKTGQIMQKKTARRERKDN